MGIFKETFRIFNFVITLGGSEALADAKSRYDALYKSYVKEYDKAKTIEQKITRQLIELGELIKQAKKALLKSEKLLGDNFGELKIPSNQSQTIVKAIKSFNSSYKVAISAGFGGILGGSSALGAWAVVSVLGSASTGTAIAGLSGIAATNATLAWFGGGALAAGGAGMSGGMMMLGGIIAAPMVYFAAKSSHAKAEKTDAECKKILAEREKLSQALPMLQQQLVEIREITGVVTRITNDFANVVDQEYQIIRPFGFISYFTQKLKRLIGLRALTQSQLTSLKKVHDATDVFLSAFSATQK